MVMEYLDGESLAERLSKGALPLAEALRYAIQIADALVAAHDSGVVHRDLKPANVIIIGAGAKLLDFGLAKAAPGDGPADTPSALPTRDRPLTEEGSIVGTIQYMSPEQLEGKDADERSDLFAFGALLFEMLTGKKAFSGTSKASLIAAIMSADPPRVSTLRPVSPPSLDRIVERCLAKDPRKRWQTALDLREELDWVREAASATTPPHRVWARPGGGRCRGVRSVLAFP
jgi:serine/threonine protein kinase